MIALSLALVVVGLAGAGVAFTHVLALRDGRLYDHRRAVLSLEMERARMEASRPVPPHEELVAKVADLERRVGSVETWVKR